MAIVDVELAEESKKRYLTYALSVVSSRALPDVRDGLKPVQRRILYAMSNNLRLLPEKPHRKSAAVVGEVLARYHPHGDTACYEAMVRMAQDFTYRYPLVDGQGNFGSLDGDAAAAYRYTEVRLNEISLELIGDIGQETVSERDNFDQTLKEPVVLPSRIPNLLVNGSSGIAVGMATSIPPHNLKEVIQGLLLLLSEPEVQDTKLYFLIKGPDFPTGCEIVNSKAELRDIYTTGRGAVRMRGGYRIEESKKKGAVKNSIIISSVPYSVDKSALVAQIADLIIARKVSQLLDIRDESTAEVRIVLELVPGSDPDKIMAYLYKHTALQSNFHVNLTALVPTKNPLSGKPLLLSLRQMLQHFIDFRIEVTIAKLLYEQKKLVERVHLLEGLAKVLDVLDELIEIVRKSTGRADAAKNLCRRFKLTELQALFIVDLRIYQLSRTAVEEIISELDAKRKRIAEIEHILGNEQALKKEVAGDLERIAEKFGDARRCRIISDYEETEVKAEEFITHEDVLVIVTRDGWLKRMRAGSDIQVARIREGDSIFFSKEVSTKDTLILCTNLGNVFGMAVYDIIATTGFGEPVQKIFRFQDGELITAAFILPKDDEGNVQRYALLYSARGNGYRLDISQLGVTKKIGRRIMRLLDGDTLQGICELTESMILLLSRQGYGICIMASDAPVLNIGSKGVRLQKVPTEDSLVCVRSLHKQSKVTLPLTDGKNAHIDASALTIGLRGNRGLKLIKRGTLAVSRE